MQYVLKTYGADAPEPMLKTAAFTADAQALDHGRGLLRRMTAVRQVEVWRGERRIATVERVV